MRAGLTIEVPVYLEVGSKRTFAGALEWPGWSRSGRSEEQALDALLAYGPRYGEAVSRADRSFEAPRDVIELLVVERVAGMATTDFGAPGVPPSADVRPLDEAELDRLLALLAASWQAFDAAVAGAEGLVLRTGPRGGGRDLAKMVAHVGEAEEAYVSGLGARPPRPDGSVPSAGRLGPAATLAPLRAVAREAVRARALGKPIEHPAGTRTLWSPRYFVRRAAWHALDHAWEIEDRAAR